VGQGQSVFVSKHSKAIQKRGTKTMSNIATMPTTPKPQPSKEVIAANVQLLIEQLEAGHSEELTAYLTAMGRFHNYSFSNILEIARQKPDATRVAGLYAWNQLGRKVMKGQKGIRILAPMIGSRKKKVKVSSCVPVLQGVKRSARSNASPRSLIVTSLLSVT
jgi:N-terminal domain of anti-restriction factor ArdC